MSRADEDRAPTTLILDSDGTKPNSTPFGAVAFGTSMLPFFKPGQTLWVDPTKTQTVGIGDIITFCQGPGNSTSHRVIRVWTELSGKTFLTKGDNRLHADSPVSENQVLGKVVRVEEKDLEIKSAKRFFFVVALLSYGQWVLYRLISKSVVNRFRYLLEKKRLFPAIRLQDVFYRMVNPVGFFSNRALEHPASTGYQANPLSGITPGSSQESGAMAQVWNQAFEKYQTNTQRLERYFLRDREFDPEGCALIKDKNGEVIGWIAAGYQNLHRDYLKGRIGIIRMAAISLEGFQLGADRALIRWALEWLRKKGAREIRTASFPVPKDSVGIPFSPLFSSLAAFGFEIEDICAEFYVDRFSYKASEIKIPEGVQIKECESCNVSAIGSFLKEHARSDVYDMYDHAFLTFGTGNGALAAFVDGRPIGYCRWLLDDQIKDCGEVNWPWVISTPELRRGYFFHLIVDPLYRHHGIGTALAARAFERLFMSGCDRVGLTAEKDNTFYRRFGFERQDIFVEWQKKL